MKIISVSNIKGGVGKTTTVAVLAVGLVEKGYKVLMVDSDPQANLSICFMQEQSDEIPSLYHVYSEEGHIEDVKTRIKDRLDIVPRDFSLCNADMQFLKAGRLKMLQRAFKRLKTEYDFAVIDTSPNMGILSLNAFFVSDYVIVPAAVDSFSLKGIMLLKETIDDVSEEAGKELPVAGILLTKYNSRTKVSKLLEKSLNSAAALLDTELFKNRIRQAVVLQECQIAKEDLFSYAANAKVTEDYRGFINEFLERTVG